MITIMITRIMIDPIAVMILSVSCRCFMHRQLIG